MSPQEVFREHISSSPVMDRVGARIFLLEVYEMVYGICQHYGHSNPISSVLLHPTEEMEHRDPLKYYMRSYLDNKISNLGISFNEFMNMPEADLKRLSEVAASINKVTDDDQRDELNKLMEDMKK